MTEKINAKTPAGAAKAFYRFICEQARKAGQDPDIEVHLWKPEDTRHYTSWSGEGSWQVAWEAGPFEWAVHLSMFESMFRGEMAAEAAAAGLSPSWRPQIDLRSDHWIAEPGYSFSMGFHAL